MRRSISMLIFVALLVAPQSASARATEHYAYTYEQLWRAVVRLIAVEYRFPITERDQDNGYVLFEYREQGRSCAGSMELVRTRDPHGQARVSIVVTVNEMPSYIERMLLDRLGHKLGEEYGAPPAPPRPRETPPSETPRSRNRSGGETPPDPPISIATPRSASLRSARDVSSGSSDRSDRAGATNPATR